MYKKLKSLQDLERRGLNTFSWWVPDSLEKLQQLVREKKKVTVRFDSADDKDSLPFYVLDRNIPYPVLILIWYQANAMNCILIISDGIQYDMIQKYNLVAKINRDGSFIAEASTEKVPLRKMYNYPLLSINGNLNSRVHDWECSDYYGINRFEIKEILEDLQNLGLVNCWVELTIYPKPVGQRKENLIFWQIN